MKSQIKNYENKDNDNYLYYKYNSLLDINKNYSTISNIDSINSFIIIVDFPRLGGGTTNFLNTIILQYKYHQTFLILRNIDNLIHVVINEDYILEQKYTCDECIDFLQMNINKIEKIFVNHIKCHTNNFIDKMLTLSKEKTYITHDYSILFDNSQPFYEDIVNKNNIKHNNYINKFDNIITQNIKNVTFLNDFIDENKIPITVTELPDYRKSLDLINTNNDTIIIGLIGSISGIKGEQIVNELNNYINKNNFNMKIIIFGRIDNSNVEYYEYKNICELNNLLLQYKPNVLLECSIWPETYSYTLTICMLTQLPIISLNKNFDSVIHNRLENYDKKYFFNNIEECIEIIISVKQDYLYTIDPNIYYNKFWDNYFITRKKKEICLLNEFKHDIKPYFIYFPQFHEIEENNTKFYQGFTDIINLKHLIYDKKYANLETPLFEELGIESFQDYDLTNHNIIKKQINIANDYNISGFAIYYYWFSKNEITNKNMIMEKVINNFFDSKTNLQNLKIFFIWANENWSKNAAFGESELLIENIYNTENIKKNIDNLINYFKHDNYLKIDNKPVFFIYHPFLMKDEEINLFYEILNNECILNHFSGVHLVLNSISKDYPDHTNFYINFNYKLSSNKHYNYTYNRSVIDYKLYTEEINNSKKNRIQSIVYDFDNAARLSKPNKLHISTICVNNTEINKSLYTDKIIETYNDNSKKEIDKILLINAFNEWGEKMTFEPSNEHGYYNLNLLKSKLIEKDANIKKNIVLITSKIYVSEHPFSYYHIRSSYTSQERFQQTIETIESIKKYIPNYFIVLFDNSNFSLYEIDTLNKMVDKFINVTDNETLNYYTDVYEIKAFADISQQIAFYDLFLKDVNFNHIQNFFKISGRYLINESFNFSNYDNEDNIMKKNDKITDKNYFFTCFYKLDKSLLDYYFNKLKEIRLSKDSYYNMDCQTIIPLIIDNKLTLLEHLGITQRIAIKNSYIDHYNDTLI